ncbi:B1 protein [Leptinotarsa decemlineata]|uniref:B1 protein n=1 Tax=Leptinotarsa decemlineata TaxID=7539 RepID=UPI003D30B700
MKVLLIALIVCASIPGKWCLSDDSKQMMMEIHNACLAESGVSPDIIGKMMQGEFIDDSKLKEHLICFAKKEGLMNDSGDVNEEAVREKIHAYIKDETTANEILSKCVVKMATPQDTAFHFSKCMFTTVKH